MKTRHLALSTVVLAASLLLGACASNCSEWQPEKNPRSASGVPGPGPLAFDKRVIFGQVLKETDATWSTLNRDVYLHVKANPGLVLTPEQKMSAAEGTRMILGPSLYATTYAAVRSEPLHDAAGNLTHDICGEVITGYAALWGWRPYIRLQRVSAAAEGTRIIGRVMFTSSTQTKERVYLLENNSGLPVQIRELNTGALKATLVSPDTYVDLTTIVTGSNTVTAAGAIQNIPTGDPFVAGVKAKMN